MNNDEKIKQIEMNMKRLFNRVSTSFIAKVVSDSDYTCDVEDLSGTLYNEVRKTATDKQLGVIMMLKKDSYVIVSRLSNSDELFLSMISEIESIKIKADIVINDGDNGGLIVIEKLTKKLNNLVQKVNSLINSYNSHTHQVQTSGTAISQAGTAYPILKGASTTETFNSDDYKNDKIKH